MWDIVSRMWDIKDIKKIKKTLIIQFRVWLLHNEFTGSVQGVTSVANVAMVACKPMINKGIYTTGRDGMTTRPPVSPKRVYVITRGVASEYQSDDTWKDKHVRVVMIRCEVNVKWGIRIQNEKKSKRADDETRKA